MKYSIIILSITTALMFLSSCEKFFEPDQELNITEDKLFDDWYEYRATEMGLYGLQQELVEQMVVLGELRGDLLTITPNGSQCPTSRSWSATQPESRVSEINQARQTLTRISGIHADEQRPVTALTGASNDDPDRGKRARYFTRT